MKTITEIKNELAKIKKSGRQTNRLQNEGGEGFDHADNNKIEALLRELSAAKSSAFAEEWTKGVTASRRAEWNAVVNAAKKGSTPRSLGEKVDFDFLDLKKAIALYA